MKVREVIRRLEEEGWQLVRTKGSHRVDKHSGKPGIVLVPGHVNDDLAPGTLRGVARQAQLEDLS